MLFSVRVSLRETNVTKVRFYQESFVFRKKFSEIVYICKTKITFIYPIFADTCCKENLFIKAFYEMRSKEICTLYIFLSMLSSVCTTLKRF